MSTFTYIASTKEGKMVEGELEAKDQAAVIAYLEKRGQFPLSLKEKKRRRGLSLSFSNKITPLDKIVFTRNLSLMTRAGMGISEAVDILYEDAERPAMRRVLARVKAELEQGSQLSDALAQFPKHFPPLFINLLKAGEASGNLEETLIQISTQLKKDHDLKKKVASAMAYPAILVSLATGVILLLIIFVLPRVSKIFTQAKLQLPIITRILLNISDFFAAHWIVVLIALGALVCALVFAFRSTAGRTLTQTLFRHMPLVGTLMQKVALTRFTSTMHVLLKAGVPIIRALEITASAAGNAAFEHAIQDMAKNEVSKGISLGMALKRRPEYFPRLVASMVVVGEKSGNLEEMLSHLANFYEDEVDGTLKGLITFLEPILLLAIGLIIGTLALSIIMPIYQMISSVR